jgi:hypothetical protein
VNTVRTFRVFVVALLACFALGCGRQAETRPPGDTPGPAPRGTPDPKAPAAPPEPEPGEAVPTVVADEAARLKPFGLIVVPSGDGMLVKLRGENVAAGRIKPDVLAALTTTTTLASLNFDFLGTFTDAGLADVKDFPNLRGLNLVGTKVTDAGLVHLKALTKLNEVDLTDTTITDKGLANLNGLTELKELHLGNFFNTQDVTDAGLGRLKLGKLKKLTISHTKVTDTGLAQLKDSKELTALGARACDMTDAGLVHLKPLVSITWLKLEATKITDAGLVHLEALPNLVALEVDKTAVTKAAATRLQQKLPGCYVIGPGFSLGAK